MLFVKYQDGELVQVVGWNGLPDKPIQKISLVINNKRIILENYESYNYLIERGYNIIGNNLFIRNIYIMGKIGNLVKVITVNTFDNKIYEYENEFGKEYLAGYTGQLITSEYNGRPSTGWKAGVFSLIPIYKII
jgi:hypothetical protein